MTRLWASLSLALLLLASPAGAEESGARGDRLFQYSTINALLKGLYDGDLSIAGLAAEGDTGLGTINGIDGEMIALDGDFYVVKVDGRAHKLAPGERTPFALVTFFAADRSAALPAGLDYAGLEKHLDGLIAGRNDFQAFRIEGRFPKLTVRSEPKQTPPYRPLAEVIKEEQAVFELSGVRGTMIGFRTPDYMGGLDVPGYHFHFITEDRARGGHVLDLESGSGVIRIDELTHLELALPEVPGFDALDLGGARPGELNAVERQK